MHGFSGRVAGRTPFAGLAAGAVLLAGCAASTSAHTPTPTPAGATTPAVQSAVVCPPPPANAQPVANPPRHFASPPPTVIAASMGYCAYVDTAAGVISIRLRPESAPKTVNNFVFLAEHGFYDGLTFFEVCPDPGDSRCPAQAPIAVAGDPTGTGTGGPGYTIPAESVVGDYLFGVVAMYGSNPSAVGSEFFISKGDARSLPHAYVIFGEITGGIPALAALQKGDPIRWVAIEPT